jgi:cell division protein FtsX
MTVIKSILRRTARIVVEHPRSAVWTLVAITAALFATATAALIAENVDDWTTAHRGGTAGMVVYLGETVDDAHAKALVTELAALPGVERAELVSPAESARRLRQALSGDPNEAALLDGVELASIPASVEVTLAPGVRDVIAMSPTVRALRGAPGVTGITLAASDVVADHREDRVASTLATVQTIAWSAAALIAALSVVVVIASIRVRLERRRSELAVAHLLGGGPTLYAVPTALAGALVAIVAAVLAAILLCIFVRALGGSLEQSLATALGPVEVAVPSLGDWLLFIAGGGVLGMIGGGLAGSGRAR